MAPIPLDAPVTTTTRPDMSGILSAVHLSLAMIHSSLMLT
jgi:hypothetical protein